MNSRLEFELHSLFKYETEFNINSEPKNTQKLVKTSIREEIKVQTESVNELN